MTRKAPMGHIYADVTVHGRRGRKANLRLLVDTGASYSWLPSTLLESLGVRPMRTDRFELGDNRVIRRRVGEAVVEILGLRATTIVVFARRSDANVLGVHALEGLGLEVDPYRERLKRMETLLFIHAVSVAAGTGRLDSSEPVAG